jgi:hypothetical protein
MLRAGPPGYPLSARAALDRIATAGSRSYFPSAHRARQPCRLITVGVFTSYLTLALTHWQISAPRQHDTAVRDAIQRLVLANGRYHRG